MRDERVVRFRRERLTYREIATAEGIGRSTVGDIMKKWLAECGPSAEVVDELRQLQGDQLERDASQVLAAPDVSAARPRRRRHLYQGPEGNHRPIEVPDPAVSQQVLRIMERRAKLFGLDMQQGVCAPQITAEMLAELFSDASEPPIDVEGEEEMPDEQEALGRGSGD